MIKTVTGFKTIPVYVTAIQVFPDNIEEVKEFCGDMFSDKRKSLAENILGHVSQLLGSSIIKTGDFIVKDSNYNSRFIVLSRDEFWRRYDRAEE